MKTKYKIGAIICPDADIWEKLMHVDHGVRPVFYHTYLAVGIQNKKGFTGFAHDYTGGGEYKDALFLNGQRIDTPDNEWYAAEYDINTEYPQLMQQVKAYLDRVAYRDYDMNRLAAKKNLAKRYLGHVQDALNIGAAISSPPEFGETVFIHSMS